MNEFFSLQGGVSKLNEATSLVDDLKKKADEQSKLLTKKQAEADAALKGITQSMQVRNLISCCNGEYGILHEQNFICIWNSGHNDNANYESQYSRFNSDTRSDLMNRDMQWNKFHQIDWTFIWQIGFS